MKIGLLTTSFPRFEGDVAGSFVLGFARALAARGHTLRVLAPEPLEDRIAPLFGPAICTRHVRYVRPRSLARTFYGAGVLDNARDVRAWPGLATYGPALAVATLRELSECDALVSHFGVPCGLVAAALRGNRPHVAVLHSADLHALERLPAGGMLALAIATGADHVTCVTEHARQRFLRLVPAARRASVAPRVHVQAMGLDARALAAGLPERSAARARLGSRRFTLLTLARLVPIKGLCEALEALSERAELEWLIAGDGPLRGELERRASRSRARVRLVGEVHGAAKLELLAAADALLLPSRTLPSGRAEGAPLALLEAMAAGVPVIAANTGGIGELLEHGRAGELFEADQPSSLLAAIERVRAGNLQNVIVRARELANAHDWSLVGERYERWLSYI